MQQRGRRSSPANSRSNTPPFGQPQVARRAPLTDFVLPDDASARVFDIDGNFLDANDGATPTGSAQARDPDTAACGSRPNRSVDENGTTTGYVQYGRSIAHVDATIDRLWLFIVAGILGGTLLASFAGVAIAGRAMRPIASLTATAREIATTRDPSRRMPEPAVDDEVGELALTLEQMLRSLDAARAEREGAMQKQREFVADASHELRTPLTSVLANLELLQASLGGPDQAEDREVVDSALRSSRRMSRLVGDLLLLARADAGRLDEHSRCDLAEIAGDAAAEAAPLMGDRTLTVDNDRPLRVEGSADELHRMVLNLLDNAARHTPAGSRSNSVCARSTATRSSRSPTTAPASRRRCGPRSSTASSAAKARPTPPGAPAPASAWRSSAPSPTPTAAASRPRIEGRRRPLPRPHPADQVDREVRCGVEVGSVIGMAPSCVLASLG